MAKNCPQDLVRALVEGTLGVAGAAGDSSSGIDADERVGEVLSHLQSCAACRRLRDELEEEEKLVRAAVGMFGNRENPASGGEPDEGDTCPPPAQLAAFTEGVFEGNLAARLEAHVASCALCRASFVAASTPVMVAVSDDALAAARRRLALVRSAPVATRSDSRRTSARRKPGSRTGKYAPITPLPARSGGFGVLVAAAAAVLVAVGIFAFRDTGDRPAGSVAQRDPETRPVDVRPSTAPTTPETRPSRAPRPETSPELPAPQPSAPAPADSPEAPAVALAPPAPSPDEEDPSPEEPTASQGPRGVGPANSQPIDAPSPEAAPAQGHEEPARRAPAPAPVPAERIKRTPAPALACAVASLEGTVELHKKDAKGWRSLTLADVVEEGDAIRAKGVDSGFTFVGRAAVRLDAEAVGRVSFEGQSVTIALEAGSLEGEALARNGLKVSDAHGHVTLWKGAKVRVESLPEGLRVCVDAGRVRVDNAHGHCVVREGAEALVSREREPRSSSSRGPRRTPRR